MDTNTQTRTSDPLGNRLLDVSLSIQMLRDFYSSVHLVIICDVNIDWLFSLHTKSPPSPEPEMHIKIQEIHKWQNFGINS